MVEDEVLQYILVRSDIKMSKGKTAAQVAHAAVECYIKLFDKIIESKKGEELSYFMEVRHKWLSTGTKKVVLDAGSISRLDGIIASLDDDIIAHVVVDQGRTEIEPDTITCVGVGPDYASKLTPMFQDLELL